MSENPPKHHLVASLIASIAVIAVVIFAINYGQITPTERLETALANTIALDSVNFNLAGSAQLKINQKSRIDSLALSGSLTDLRSTTPNWLAHLDFSQADLGTTASTPEDNSWDIGVIAETAYVRLGAVEPPTKDDPIVLTANQWYRLLTEPMTLGLSLTAEQTEDLRAAIADPRLWGPVVDAGLDDGRRQLRTTIDLETLLTAIPDLAFWSAAFTIDPISAEFSLTGDDEQIERLTIGMTLSRADGTDTIELNLAIRLVDHDGVAPLTAPVAIDTLTELPAWDLLN